MRDDGSMGVEEALFRKAIQRVQSACGFILLIDVDYDVPSCTVEELERVVFHVEEIHRYMKVASAVLDDLCYESGK